MAVCDLALLAEFQRLRSQPTPSAPTLPQPRSSSRSLTQGISLADGEALSALLLVQAATRNPGRADRALASGYFVVARRRYARLLPPPQRQVVSIHTTSRRRKISNDPMTTTVSSSAQ